MKKKTIVNIYNFVRMAHEEPSRFIKDDFDTVKNQLITVKQYGLPATWALKYDALMNPQYQELFLGYTDDSDEIGAWWEITGELCRKAGVKFRGACSEEFDERVDSAYSIGYEPEERKRLVDAYMEDFYGVFGFYPKTIGSWVLDTVTLSYAQEKYKILAGAICRDQIGTDGFTLWGGFPGIYYPAKKNENMPAQTLEEQLPVTMFRLLSPDPVYSFEQEVRSGLYGVYTLEPCCENGRDKNRISWYFDCLTKEDSHGIGYAQVGQENNFLWENIRPGFAPQLAEIRTRWEKGELLIETMEETARRFQKNYRLTPPLGWQASKDWDTKKNLSAQWYAGRHYRLGLLGEAGKLRIRDFFVYRQDYASRYLQAGMKNNKSNFDALPLLFAQLWKEAFGKRPFIRFLDENGEEVQGKITFYSPDAFTSAASLKEKTPEEKELLTCLMSEERLVIRGGVSMHFDFLPVWKKTEENRIVMEHENFSYSVLVEKGLFRKLSDTEFQIQPEQGEISILLADEEVYGQECKKDREELLYTSTYFKEKKMWDEAGNCRKDQETEIAGKRKGRKFQIPLPQPYFEPAESVFEVGQTREISIFSPAGGTIYYTLDGSEPDTSSLRYEKPLPICKDTCIKAKVFDETGKSSLLSAASYLFGRKDVQLFSDTVWDPRPVFYRNGVSDLLKEERGSLDYQDGKWLGTLDDFKVTAVFEKEEFISEVSVGFLSHHRSGIVYPDYVELFGGEDKEHMQLLDICRLPCEPAEREIAKKDVTFHPNQNMKCLKIIAHRYKKMPAWCCYKGVEAVFTMADNLIIK